MTGPRAAAAAIFQAAGGAGILRAAGDRWTLERGPTGSRLRRRKAPPFLILIYHRVHPEPTPFMIDAIPPERFDRQMRHLAEAYHPLALDELIERSRTGTVPKGAVAVTFDDGYADNESHALPILRKHGVPATVFLVTGCIETGRVPWHDEVLLAFAGARGGSIAAVGGPEGTTLPLHTEAERHRAAFATLAALKPLPEMDRLAAVAKVRAALGAESGHADGALMLDWEGVRRMRSQGIQFGAHTVTHPILSRVTPDRAREEIAESKRAIEEKLGEAVTLFAYPNGRPEDFTDTNVSQVQTAGFRAALTTSFGANETGDDPFRWRRGTPWETDPARFALKVAYYRLQSAASSTQSAHAGVRA